MEKSSLALRRVRRVSLRLALGLIGIACSRSSSVTSGVIAAAASVDQRVNEGRVDLAVDYRPLPRSHDTERSNPARLIGAAADAEKQWRRERTTANARLTGV